MVIHSILVVDDVPANTMMLVTILEKRDFKVHTAMNGFEALEQLAREPIDLVLLDVMMPKMDGFEVCQRIKADPAIADIPVLFFSALHSTEEKVRAFDAGGVDYITKPFNIKEVIARVTTHLQLREQQRELDLRYRQLNDVHQRLERFVSSSAREALVQSETVPDPVYRELTILFSDIANFTPLSDRLSPLELIADLTIYMSLASSVIYDYGGQIDKFLGDGILAFFENSVDAVAAACHMQQAIQDLNQQQRSDQRLGFDTRIGIATGKVLQAAIGIEQRREWALLGDRVNVAARLQGFAPYGGILMDAKTYASIQGTYVCEELSIELKGKREAELSYLVQPLNDITPGD